MNCLAIPVEYLCLHWVCREPSFYELESEYQWTYDMAELESQT
jgi:hypothetical protein